MNINMWRRYGVCYYYFAAPIILISGQHNNNSCIFMSLPKMLLKNLYGQMRLENLRYV